MPREEKLKFELEEKKFSSLLKVEFSYRLIPRTNWTFFPQVQILIFLHEATQSDHCISLNSVQNVLVVLGVVDMCHLLLRIIYFFCWNPFIKLNHNRPTILAIPVFKSLKVEQIFSFFFFYIFYVASHSFAIPKKSFMNAFLIQETGLILYSSSTRSTVYVALNQIWFAYSIHENDFF